MTESYRQAKECAEGRNGVGLGLRWSFLRDVLERPTLPVAFWEVSPENYMRRGGFFPEALERLAERYEFICHGLSMSVGATDPPSSDYMTALSRELARMQSPWHSDHLCLGTAGPLVLHELLPLPFTKSTVGRCADRIRAIEDTLGVPFAVENVSYYAEPAPAQMSELDFLCEVLDRSGAGLLLDVNNVYVNSQNHGYDAADFIRQLPLERVVQMHVAGHTRLEAPDPAAGLLLDNHGTSVIPPVKELLRSTLKHVGPVPVLLERDNDIPELDELISEVEELQRVYDDVVKGGVS